jgi:hypothetical protein
MENMDKGPTVPKWVLIVWPKIPLIPQNLSAQFVFPSPKIWDFGEKRLYWTVDWPVNQRMEFQEVNSTKISIM